MSSVQKATHGQTRSFNASLVLRTIYDRSPISRAEVARATGLTRTSVSDLAGELIEARLVEEVGRGPSTGGKAPILLRVVADARLVIGIDVADGELRGALVDLRGEIRQTRTRELGGRDGEAAVRLVDELIAELVAIADRPLLGIGVATPGVIDSDAGIVRWSVHLDWRDLPLGPMIAERHGLPVHVVNDSQSAALAEFTFGLHPGRGNVVVVKVGRGIGAGIIVGGRLFGGDGHGAGEIGHTTIAEGDIACRCGRFGCLETFASSRGLVLRARQLATRIPGSLLSRFADDPSAITLETLQDAFAAGDLATRQLVLEGGRSLGAAIAGIVGMLDIERIVLVGTVPAFGDEWLDAVRDEVHRRALPMLAERARIEIGLLSPDVAVLGASALMLTRELGLSLAR